MGDGREVTVEGDGKPEVGIVHRVEELGDSRVRFGLPASKSIQRSSPIVSAHRADLREVEFVNIRRPVCKDAREGDDNGPGEAEEENLGDKEDEEPRAAPEGVESVEL